VLRALCLALALPIWVINYPGLMSADSIAQYRQALTGEYTDWHPPLHAFLLSLFLRSGLGLAGFTLVQCVAGLLGVRSLLQALLEAMSGGPVMRRGAWGIAVVIGLLLSPLSPLPFYLVTFWKDTLLAVVMLWLAVLLVRLLTRKDSGQPYSRAAAVATVVVLAGALSLIRDNAAVMLPACGWALWRVMRGERWPSRLAVATAPLLVAVVAFVAIDRGLQVAHQHQGNSVMARDLVGMLVVDEGAAADLKYTTANLEPDYRERFVFGGLIFVTGRSVVKKDFVKTEYDPRMVEEYWRAIRRHPLVLAEVKTRAFLPLLQLTRTPYWFDDAIERNPFGLKLNSRLRRVRDVWTSFSLWLVSTPLRWIGGVHAVWIAVMLVMLWTTRRTPHGAVLASLGAIALSYDAGYWLAATVDDFRMMYPATLLTQVIAGASVIARLAPLRPSVES
jgi:hypothetical protein